MNLEYAKRQFLLSHARAMRCHAEITSGGYKLSNKQRGHSRNVDGTISFRQLTDEEKLQDKIEEMNRHLRLAQECSDNMYEYELSNKMPHDCLHR